MPHPLATDPTLDPVLRRAFTRVTCQIVRTYSDGSKGRINMTNRARAETELVEHRKRIGRTFASGRAEPVILVSVEIESIA